MRIDPTPLQTFLVKVVDEHAHGRQIGGTPLVCVDECLNRAEIFDLCLKLVTSGIAAGSDTLWYQLRKHVNGEHSLLGGGSKPKDFPQGYELGLPVKGWSWTDRKVAEALIVRFSATDRLVFLSENTRLDSEGIRNILRDEVAETLADHHHGRLALLAVFKRGKTSMTDFVHSVYTILSNHVFVPGFEERLV
ncbi:MAG: hypothetical protein QM703_19405 [Gemmatales bacterium]